MLEINFLDMVSFLRQSAPSLRYGITASVVNAASIAAFIEDRNGTSHIVAKHELVGLARVVA